MTIIPSDTVILANGDFPNHPIPLGLLRDAVRIVCCDGAAAKLQAFGLMPTWIVGDLDSLTEELRQKYADRIAPVSEQSTNDLAKAFRFCVKRNWRDMAILGATGGREDHTLGNLSLLADFQEKANVRLYTDTGVFTAVRKSTVFPSFPGQQVSLFSFTPGLRVYTEGLKYSLEDVPFTRWWQATLNESLSSEFRITFLGGPLLVFQTYDV